MTWSSASEFFAMGGYAAFVWGSFGVTAACIVVEIIMVKARHRAASRALPKRASGQTL